MMVTRFFLFLLAEDDPFTSLRIVIFLLFLSFSSFFFSNSQLVSYVQQFGMSFSAVCPPERSFPH